MSVIVQTASGFYGLRMSAALLRLLTLLALVLMSFGMASTPAVAQAIPANHAVTQTGHCDKQSPDHNNAPVHSSQQMHCAMCAALPASEPPTPAAEFRPTAPRTIAAVSPFNGIELEIATPPPRHS